MPSYSKRRCSLLLNKKYTQSDLVSNPIKFTIIWITPILLLICSTLSESKILTGLIWSISLCWMGVACLFNAKQCKRTHCFYTGPFFIVMAIVAFLFGYNFISLGDNAWILLGAISVAGGILIWNLSESIFGKYMRNKCHLLAAVSTGRCNTCIKSFSGCFIA